MKANLSKIFGVTITLFMLTLILFIYKKNSIETVNKLMPISRINTDRKVVAIVCNVYEGSKELDEMLRILKSKNINISFFLGGIWAKNNGDIILKMKSNGHDIQNHGFAHKLPSTLSKKRNIEEIRETEEIIYNISGVRTNLFEPPSGDYDENSLKLVNTLGYRTVTWSIDTIDWRKDATGELIMGRIKKKLHPGGIILIHPKPVTAENLKRILDYLEEQGYEITTVSKLIHNN